MKLTGAVDLHVHSAPDVRPRKMTSMELAHAAKAEGMRGLLLKNHHTSTVGVAATLREAVPGLEVFGGLALNEAVGGFNPSAVEMALKMDAAEIWMPTLSAEQERAHRGHPGTGLTIFGADGRLLPAVNEILRLIADAGAILGTGHLSPKEIGEIVRAGRVAGVRKIVITHPEIVSVNLSLDLQRELAATGPEVYFERCYVRPLFVLGWDEFAKAIRYIGFESTVLATDLGQPENPDPVSGLREMAEQLGARGFTQSELDRMLRVNPAVLLGLE